MPVIQLNDPLSAASNAVGGFTAQKNENLDRAEAQRQRDATLALQREQLASQERYQEGSLANQSRQIDLQHERDLVQAHHIEVTDQIAQADEAFTRSLDGITRETMQAHLRGEELGNLDAEARLKVDRVKAQYADQLAKLGLTTAQAQAHVAQVESKFAEVFAKQRVQQGQASIDATEAGAAASRASAAASAESTSERRQLFPYELGQAQVGLATAKRTFSELGNSPTIDKGLEQDYRAQLSSWTRRNADFQKRSAAGTLIGDEKAPPEPMSPLDFEATVADSVDAVKKDPGQLEPMVSAIARNGSLSPYQKRLATLRLRAAGAGAHAPPKPPAPKPPTPPPQPTLGQSFLHAPGTIFNVLNPFR